MAIANNIIAFGAGDFMSSIANYAQIWNVLSNAVEVDNDALPESWRKAPCFSYGDISQR